MVNVFDSWVFFLLVNIDYMGLNVGFCQSSRCRFLETGGYVIGGGVGNIAVKLVSIKSQVHKARITYVIFTRKETSGLQTDCQEDQYEFFFLNHYSSK